MNSSSLLRCLKLSKSYQEGTVYTKVFQNITFTLQHGEMIAIVGSSGSGKSTLLHILAGLDKPTSGEIIFEGQVLSKLSITERALIRNRRLGFIYQFHHLLLDFSALENVAMPLLIGGTTTATAQKISREILSAVGLEKRIHHRPAKLSGGERQRIAIARALVNNPALVLADEPTGSLDQHNTDIILELLKKLNIKQGTAFIIATHDHQLAKRLHRQFEMCNGTLQFECALLGNAQ